MWEYFTNVIEWVESLFPEYRREMKGLSWGKLYNEYKDKMFDPDNLEERIIELFEDDDVTSNKGVYLYLLTGEEKYLNIRLFNDRQKRKSYTEQEGICPACEEEFSIEEMEADHIIPWHLGGKTIEDNCQMLCKKCNRQKSGK